MSYADYVAHYLDTYAVRDMVNFGPFFGYLNARKALQLRKPPREAA